MRIPLIYSDGLILLPAVLFAGHGQRFVSFVVDTGSSHSLLSPKDIGSLQVQGAAKEKIAFGGAVFDATLIDGASIKVFDEEKKLIPLAINPKALKTRRVNQEKKALAESLPSIVGIDFLKINKLSLHVLPHELLAYLDK